MIKEIVIARHYGFCMGVRRAIQIAEETAGKMDGPVTILNEIVHNDAVVSEFQQKGVGQKFLVSEVENGTLIISAHGVAPDVIAEAKDRGLNVVDATCPLVSRIYDIITEAVPRGYYIIHFGDRNHDETKGIVGYAPDRITIISSVEELDRYPDWTDRKLGLTVQTTMGLEDLVAFQEAALKKWPQIEVFDTICNATSMRQESIREMSSEVDMILVVGSQKSANSKRMANIAKNLCGRAELINSAADISEEWFTGDNDNVEKIGVSAGASTPDFLVEDVIKRLVELSGDTARVTRQAKQEADSSEGMSV